MIPRSWALSVLLALSCAKRPAAKVDASAAAPLGPSLAFQREHERHYAEDPVSAFTAVASHYLGEGTKTQVALSGRTAVFGPGQGAAAGPILDFAQRDGLWCQAGCGPGPVRVTSRRQFPLGPMFVVASPQSGSGRLLVHDPDAGARREFDGLNWFPARSEFIFQARLEHSPDAAPIKLSTNRGLTKNAWKITTFSFEYAGVEHRLSGYTFAEPAEKMSLLIPFADKTTGKESYSAGRYLMLDVSTSERETTLDFNRATNPLCAYTRHYNCALPPKSNRLPFSVQAGEMIYKEH